MVNEMFLQEVIEDGRASRAHICMWLANGMVFFAVVLGIASVIVLVQAVRVNARPVEGWAVNPRGETYQVQFQMVDDEEFATDPSGSIVLKKAVK